MASKEEQVVGGSVPTLAARREMPHEPYELLADRERLAATRLQRWGVLLSTFTVRKEMLEWARRMAARHGAQVQVWENFVGWVMAFYIAVYGENEAFWPEELSDADVARALLWERDDARRPRGVRYIPVAPQGGLP